MRRLVAGAFLLLALPAGVGARSDGGTPVAIVATVEGEQLLMVEVWTGAARAGVRLPGRGTDVSTTFDATRVLVASPSAQAVTLVDLRRGRVLATFRGLADPVDVQVSPDGRRGFVLEQGRGTLTLLDLVRKQVVGRVAVGARPSRLAVSDDLVWVAHSTSEPTLTVVDARPGERPVVTGRVPAGGAVASLRHVPDSAWLLVTYRDSGFVSKLDAGIGARVVFRRRVGARVTALGIEWLTTRLWAADRGGRIAILSARSGASLGTVRVGATVLRIEGVGSYMAVATRRDIRLFRPGRGRAATARVPAGIAGLDFAVVP